MTEQGDIRISVGAEAPSTVGTQLDPIQLSIFSHRFMSIAGESRLPVALAGAGAGSSRWEPWDPVQAQVQAVAFPA